MRNRRLNPFISYQKLYTTSELFYSQPQKSGKMSDARYFLIIFSPHTYFYFLI
ncbi:hypothetical protein LTSERUB_4251 [Salmonella enterica subsp. enterica serovar Rubislaw str. A4-653]|uniref:Uncharacterized protein n=1 Tax=Salmonella enterica subsp. enterica serovar Rubislaw str. A4-653 TaxID=913081 RepID=G5QMX3_SALRU|nr:hypothetical protein LTSERUB_4251 [Salmonella enterica subsp. enterica serovar Rubislaw str. A4-653]